VLLSAALATPAFSQSINLDIGEPADAPSATYGAAGLPGVWNSVRCEHTTANPGPQPFDYMLVDLAGNATGVGLHQFGGTELLSADDPTVSGDDATLLDDALVTHSIALKSCLYFNGLENGSYEVLTYAWMPNHPEVLNKVFFDFTPGFALVGGSWSGVHELGITYARHIIHVTNGFMGPHAGLPDDGDPAIGGALNGMQLRKVSCEGCTLYCFGDNTGTPCPCGNAGLAGRGCENSFGTGGAQLTSSGTPSISSDTVVLTASGLPPSALVLFFQGMTQQNGGLGTVRGDGLLCANGSLIRLGSRQASNGVISFGAGIPGDPLVSVRGAVPPGGAVRHYQTWYRNSARFCTADTINLTNGMTIPWGP
jgi:hypothetical protein